MKDSLIRCGWFLAAVLLVVGSSTEARAQTTYTWSGATSGAWLTTTNWAGGVVPGSSTDTTNNDIASFTISTQPNVGINFNTQNGNHYLGSIDYSNSTNRTINNSSGTTAGVLRLNGTTIGGVDNTIIRYSSTGALILANGSSAMGLQLVLANSVIQATNSGGAVNISSIISESTGGAKGITLQGGGVLQLTGSNSFTGGVTVNAGTLNLTSTSATGAGTGTITLGNTTGSSTATLLLSGGSFSPTNAITVRSGSSGTKSITVGISSIHTFSGLITLNDNLTITRGGSGASNNFTFTGGIAIDSGRTLTISATNTSVVNVATNAISGTGNVLISSAGAGATTFTAANTYTGITTVGQGSLVLSGGTNRLSTSASLVIGAGANSGVLSLNGISQTVAGLSTSGTGTSNAIVGASATMSALTVNLASGSQSYAGVLGGAAANQNNLSFTKSGAGTLTLSGTNTYTGGTNISAGTLSFANGSLGSSGNVTFTGSSTLQWASGNTQDISARLVMTNGVISTFDTNSNNVTLAAVLGSNTSGTLTKIGAGTLTLSGANTYTGNTNVNDGTLLLSGAINLPTTGSLTVGTGGNFSLADGTARTTTANGGLNFANGANLTFDWNAGSLDSLTSTAAATTTGSVGIIINNTSPTGSGGTLISAPSGLQTANNTKYFLANNTDFSATLTPSDTAVSIGAQTSQTALTNAYWVGGLTDAVGTMAFSSGASSNWASDAAGTSANGVVPGGSAVNVIFGATGASNQSAVTTGANMNLGSITFNDDTAVTIAGSHVITLNSSLGTAATTNGALDTVTAGSAISVTSFANTTNTISANIALGANQTWNVASGKTLIVRSIVAGAFSLTKADSGTLTLSGANTYTGGTNISAGALSFANGSLDSSSNVTFTGSSTLQWASGNTQDISSRLVMTNSVISTLDTNSNNVTLATAFGNSTSGALTKIGAGTLALSGANTYTGGTNISAGTLSFANTSLGTSGNVTFSGSSTLRWASGNTQDISARLVMTNGVTSTLDTNSNNVTLATAFGSSTSGTLAKIGAGTLTLSGANTYTGGTNINAGTLVFSPGSLGSSGLITFTGNSTLQWTNVTHVDISARLRMTNGVTTTFNNGANVSLGSDFGNGSTGALIKTGAGILTISGSNTFTGGVTINGGTFRLGSTGALNSTPGSENAVAFGASSTGNLQLNGQSVTIANLSTSATASIVQNAGAGNQRLTVGNSLNLSGTYAGIIQDGGGTLALTKAGTGTLTLSGANTYIGSTLVNAGTLLVNGTLATGSAVTVSGTATLGGSGGTINGTVSIGATATLAPGSSSSPGALTFGGAVTLAGGSTFAVELNGTPVGTGYDQVVLNGSASINLGGSTLSPTLGVGFTPSFSDSFVIVLNQNGSGGRTGTFNGLPNEGDTVTFSGYFAQIYYNADADSTTSALIALTGGNDVVLTNFQPVPEPAHFLLLASAVLGVGFWGRRRKLTAACGQI